MPEVTVSIYSRTYRLAVSAGEETLIQRCAETVDRQMNAIRENAKVINQDQIAVLAALEIAYEAERDASKHTEDLCAQLDAKTAEIAALQARIAELESRPVLPAVVPQAPAADDSVILAEVESIAKLCESAIFTDMRQKPLL